MKVHAADEKGGDDEDDRGGAVEHAGLVSKYAGVAADSPAVPD